MKSLLPVLLLWSVGCAGPAGPGPEKAEMEAPLEPEPEGGDRYVIDAPASRFRAQVGSSGILSMFGYDHTVAIREFAGEVRHPPDAPERSSLRMTIEAATLAETGPAFSEEDRRSIDRDIREKVLETSRYPQIVFRSTRILRKGAGRFEIRGILALHGFSRNVTVPTEVTVEGDVLTARGKFSIRHSEFGMERLSAVGGTIKATDEIRLSFELLARRR